jgi:hypothetical protein
MNVVPILTACAMSLAVSGCVGASARPMPLAASGPVAVDVMGAGYIVDLQPTVDGAQMTVSADAGSMAMDQGLSAKRAAEAFCAGRGGRVDMNALGRFVGGSWVFDGGCA